MRATVASKMQRAYPPLPDLQIDRPFSPPSSLLAMTLPYLPILLHAWIRRRSQTLANLFRNSYSFLLLVAPAMVVIDDEPLRQASQKDYTTRCLVLWCRRVQDEHNEEKDSVSKDFFYMKKKNRHHDRWNTPSPIWQDPSQYTQ